MAYQCAQFDPATLICQQWIESPSLLPPLTIEQGIAIGGAILSVMAFTAGIKHLVTFIKKQ